MYSYYWLRENGTPYYIGYGRHKTRAYAPHPRANDNCVPKPPTARIHIHKHESEHRAKLREWEMINFLKPMLCNIGAGYHAGYDASGEKNHFYGKTHTEESKRKISEGKKGVKIHSEEFREAQAERCRNRAGWKHTEEAKRRSAVGGYKQRGKKRTPEQRERYAEAARKRWSKKRGEDVL